MAVKQLHATKWGMMVCLALALAIGLGPLSSLVQSATLPLVHVWPAEAQVLVDRTGWVDVLIDDVHDLYAVELDIQYDPAVIRITDADPVALGVQVDPGNVFDGLGWHADINLVNTTTGAISYIFALDSQALAGVNGTGSLARINFTALAPGASPIHFGNIVLVRRGGESIDHASADGRVRVVEIPFTATPTPLAWVSPTATQTPLPLATSTPGAPPTVPAEVTPTSTASVPGPTPTFTPVPTPAIYVYPELQYVRPGTYGVVEIRVAEASGLYASWLTLSYNPALLQIQDADAGQAGVQIEAGSWFDGKSWYPIANLVDPVAGTITFGAKLSFDEVADQQDGVLARIQFRALSLGVSPVNLSEVILADQQGTSITPAQQNGVVVVTSVIPTLTPTPTPGTSGPTPVPSPTPTWAAPLSRPVLFLEPEAMTLLEGAEQDIDVMARDVVNLHGVQFKINYDPSVVEFLDLLPAISGTQVAYGAFLSPDSVASNSVNAATGTIQFAISQAASTPPRSGTGVVARMRVRALAQGATSLAINTTQLVNEAGLSMPHTAAGGFVAVNTQTIIGRTYLQGRDQHGGVQILWQGATIAVSGEDGGFAFACPVGQGVALDLAATISGHLTATTRLSVPAVAVVDLGDTILIGGDAVGTQIQVTRTVGCPGDPTVIVPSGPDGHINILDLTFVASHFGASSTDATWAPTLDGCHPEYLSYLADTNGDQVCNIFDLVQVGNNFGALGDQPW